MPYLRFADAFDWSVIVHTAIQDAFVRSGSIGIDPIDVAKVLSDRAAVSPAELIAEIEAAATYAHVPVRVAVQSMAAT